MAQVILHHVHTLWDFHVSLSVSITITIAKKEACTVALKSTKCKPSAHCACAVLLINGDAFLHGVPDTG